MSAGESIFLGCSRGNLAPAHLMARVETLRPLPVMGGGRRQSAGRSSSAQPIFWHLGLGFPCWFHPAM